MSVLALCGGTAFSQSQLDAFKYSQTELNGTARVSIEACSEGVSDCYYIHSPLRAL